MPIYQALLGKDRRGLDPRTVDTMTVAEVALALGVDSAEAQADRMMAARIAAAREGRPAPTWETV